MIRRLSNRFHAYMLRCALKLACEMHSDPVGLAIVLSRAQRHANAIR